MKFQDKKSETGKEKKLNQGTKKGNIKKLSPGNKPLHSSYMRIFLLLLLVPVILFILYFLTVYPGQKIWGDPIISFHPGTLGMTQRETLSRCYANPKEYADHFSFKIPCYLSKPSSLIYQKNLIAGSSWVNHEMKQWGDVFEKHKNCDHAGKYRFSFVREPYQRFLETYERTARRRRPRFHSNLEHGLGSLSFEERGHPESLISPLEKFVKLWDGLFLRDTNWKLQTTSLMNQKGLSLPFNFIGNTSQMAKDWSKLTKKYSADTLLTPPTRNADYAVKQSHFDTKQISLRTSEKICQLLALDYCCLNFVLPPECVHSGVMCEWKNIPALNTKAKFIVPKIYPPKKSILPHYTSVHIPGLDHSKNIATPIEKKKTQVEENQNIVFSPDLINDKYISQGKIVLADNEFVPGTLEFSSLQTLERCYADPIQFEQHYHGFGKPICTVSERFRLIYYHVQKSGSSSNRHVMRDYLDANKGTQHSAKCDMLGNDYRRVSFIRNPQKWFQSVYLELTRNPRAKNAPDYLKSAIIIPVRKDRKDPKHMSGKFGEFVEKWNGKLFDTHLKLQTIQLMQDSGLSRNFDFIGHISTFEDDWKKMGKKYNLPNIPKTRSRETIYKLDDSAVLPATRRKVCRLLALDYCCLNMKLPPVCEKAGVFCQWVKKPKIDTNSMFIVPVVKELQND